MSTPDLGLSGLALEGVPGASPALPSPVSPSGVSPAVSTVPVELRGTVLDPSVLGALANEMFRAIPGAPTALPQGPQHVPSAPSPEIAGVALPFAPVSHPVSSVPSTESAPRVPYQGAPGSSAPPVASSPLGRPVDAPVSPGGLRELSPLFGLAGSASVLPGAGSLSPNAPRSLERRGDLPYFLTETRPPTSSPTPVGGTHAGRELGASAIPALDPELVPALDLPHGTFEVHAVRRDFPILSERVHGKPLIWFDNAATTQKPRQVIERITEFYERENSNIHRAAHTLAARATDAYEAAREKVRRFLGASSTKEIVFVRGTTEGMNLIAKSWGARHVGAGDEIVLTTLEHHSNIVPWQMLAMEKGARLKVAPVDDSGQIQLEAYERLFTPRTRLASITHVSNALGTILPVKEMTEIAHRHGARVVIDGAQSVSHMPVDVQALGSDFYVFSGHKVFGPTGIGVVYGRSDVLEETPPWQGGGNMIVDVTFEKTVYAPVPGRLEAGTGNIADAVGLGAALDYVTELGMHQIAAYEHELLVYATERLYAIPGLRPVGTAKEKASVVSFVLDGYESHEVGVALDRDGIAVRAGHHCAQPALRRFGLETSVRPSLAFYNTKDEIDQLVRSVERLAGAKGHRR